MEKRRNTILAMIRKVADELLANTPKSNLKERLKLAYLAVGISWGIKFIADLQIKDHWFLTCWIIFDRIGNCGSGHQDFCDHQQNHLSKEGHKQGDSFRLPLARCEWLDWSFTVDQSADPKLVAPDDRISF